MPIRAAARLLPLATLALAACGTIPTTQYRSMTAGVIGCPAKEITITEEKNVAWAGQGIDWRAECRGRRFICSYSGSTACSEELRPATAASASPATQAPAQAKPGTPATRP